MSAHGPVVAATATGRAKAEVAMPVVAWPLWLVIAVALVARLAALALFPAEVVSDAIVYERQAWRIAQGLGDTLDSGQPTAFYPPLYSYFVAAFYVVAGRSRILIEVVQAVLSALVCLAVYDIARGIWRRADVALVAALLTALDFSLVLYPRVFFAETLFTALVAVTMVAWTRAWRRDQLAMWALFGVAAGLATLTRPVLNFLPLVAIAAWPWAATRAAHPRLDTAAVRRWVIVTAVVLLTFAAPLAPWWVRNARAFGHFTTEVTSSTGTGLYLSYFPSDGRRFGVPDERDPLWAEGLRLKRQGTLSAEWDRSAYLKREVLAYLAQHPMRIVTLMPAKLAHLAWPFDWTLFNGTGRLDVTYVFALPFLALGVMGVLRRREGRASAPVWLIVLYTVGITLAFLGAPRYRAPVQPYLHVFAALGLVLCVERRPAAVRWLAVWGIAVVPLAFVIQR